MNTFLQIENEKIVIPKRKTYKRRKENPIKIRFKKIAEDRKNKNIRKNQIIMKLQIENEKLKDEIKRLKIELKELNSNHYKK